MGVSQGSREVDGASDLYFRTKQGEAGPEYQFAWQSAKNVVGDWSSDLDALWAKAAAGKRADGGQCCGYFHECSYLVKVTRSVRAFQKRVYGCSAAFYCIRQY